MSVISGTSWEGPKVWHTAVLLLVIMLPIKLLDSVHTDAASAARSISIGEVSADLTAYEWEKAPDITNISSRAIDTWLQQQKLTASDAAADDNFGYRVAVDGDTIVIGAYWDDHGSVNSGSAYVFVRNDTGWSQEAKLTAYDAAAEDYFGIDVALNGNTVVIGAYGDDDGGNSSGSAYVFVRDDNNWNFQAKLTANDAAAADFFGNAVAIDGNTALIGAHWDDDGGDYSGSAYVFVRDGTSWSQQAKLLANDAEASDTFGQGVAVDNDTAVIGAPGDDDGGSNSGSAYVFVRDGTSWSQQAKLTADYPAANDIFGRAVAVDGETVVVGADYDDDGYSNSGSVYVFVRNGTSWNIQSKLTADDGATDDQFGHSVALSGDTVLIGGYHDDDGGKDSGAAYIFMRDGVSWNQQAKLTAGDPDVDDHLGNDVALSGSTAVVGAPGDNDNGSNSGSAYAFAFMQPVSVSIDDVSLAEGDEDTNDFNFAVTRTDNSEAISVDFATADSTASMTNADYLPISGTVNFAAGGSLTQQITIQVSGDARVESDETFFVNLSNASEGVTITDSQGIGTIQNDDTAGLLFMESDGATAVGEDGSTDTFEIILTSEPETNVTVILVTDAQVNLSKNILTFTPANWNTSQMVTVSAVDNSINEGDRISTVTYSSSSNDANYDSFDGTGILLTIADNDIYGVFLPMIVKKVE